MLQIRTSELKTRKKVEIDGHPYTVRRLGAGEELALSQSFRRLRAIEKKEKAKTMTDKDEDEAFAMATNVMDTLAACFDDGAGGDKSRLLVKSLSADELKAVYDKIFEEPQSETPNAPAKQTAAATAA